LDYEITNLLTYLLIYQNIWTDVTFSTISTAYTDYLPEPRWFPWPMPNPDPDSCHVIIGTVARPPVLTNWTKRRTWELYRRRWWPVYLNCEPIPRTCRWQHAAQRDWFHELHRESVTNERQFVQFITL